MPAHGSAAAYHPARCGTSSSSGRTAIHAAPRGVSSHLYAAATTASAQLRSASNQPTDWVASRTTVVPPWRAARRPVQVHDPPVGGLDDADGDHVVLRGPLPQLPELRLGDRHTPGRLGREGP